MTICFDYGTPLTTRGCHPYRLWCRHPTGPEIRPPDTSRASLRSLPRRILSSYRHDQAPGAAGENKICLMLHRSGWRG